MTDYASALWIPNSNFFPDTGKKSFVILHGTAGGSSAQEIAAFFQGTEGSNNPVSSHYIVGKDGTVVQTVLEKDGAWGNGVVTNPNWLGNPNTYTISIEHVKNQKDASGNFDNSDVLTSEQQQASFALVKDICQRNEIGMHDADDTTGITGHFSIDPVNRSRCPGAYPWDSLWQYLEGPMQPAANQLKEAQDCWNSFFKSIGQTPPPTGTGIYQAWLSDWIHQGKQYGPPITHEYNSNDWSDNPIVVQEFAHARCEWVNGAPNWYSINGKI
ncbi:MAG TPA: N-acetylmuramoyl-L-alanine amidase [Ktedonobacteraceae bacterium]|nr:N-acetylmuramoyl-L-alanine amidase [Ktedonobacteraceae bacterium]